MKRASGRSFKAARRIFLCHKKAHKAQNELTITFHLCFLCPFAANASLRLLFAHVVAVDPAILLIAILCFREEILVVFASHHFDARRHFLC